MLTDCRNPKLFINSQAGICPDRREGNYEDPLKMTKQSHFLVSHTQRYLYDDFLRFSG
jgi:hypothetical protein